MNGWQFLDRCLDRTPGWPSERQWVTIWLFVLILILLRMGWSMPSLWGVEVFKVIVQAVVLTGALNMVLAFHFAANKGNEEATKNTGDAFRAITAAQNAPTVSDTAATGPQEVQVVNKTTDPVPTEDQT